MWWTSRDSRDRAAAIKAAKAHDFAAAEPGLRRAFERDPNDVEAVELLARGYAESDDPNSTEVFLARWVELRPDQLEPIKTRFEYYQRLKKTEQAYDDGRKLLQLDPANSPLRRTLAGMAMDVGHFEEAEKLCRECLAQTPRNSSLRSLLSQIRRARGDPTEAAAILDQLLDDEPGSTRAMFARAVLYEEAGDVEKAIPLLREVVKKDASRQRTAGYQLGMALERAGKREEARLVLAEVRRLQDVATAEEAINNQPMNLDVRVRMAQGLLAAGHSADGLSFLETVVKLDPTFPPRMQHWRRIMRRLVSRRWRPNTADSLASTANRTSP